MPQERKLSLEDCDIPQIMNMGIVSEPYAGSHQHRCRAYLWKINIKSLHDSNKVKVNTGCYIFFYFHTLLHFMSFAVIGFECCLV